MHITGTAASPHTAFPDNACSLLVLPAVLCWLLWFSLRVSRRCCRSWASCGTGHHRGCGWAPAHAAGTAADTQQQRPLVSEQHSTEQHLNKQTPLMLSARSRNLRSLANPIALCNLQCPRRSFCTSCAGMCLHPPVVQSAVHPGHRGMVAAPPSALPATQATDSMYRWLLDAIFTLA
jgi:hypothetical protein